MNYGNAQSMVSISEQMERGALLLELVQEIQAVVDAAGKGDGFDAVRWVEDWLHYPIPLFCGERGVDLIETREGRAKIRYLMNIFVGETCV